MALEVKLWTVEEANTLLPRLDRLVTQLRGAYQGVRSAQERAVTLERTHGRDTLLDLEHPAHRAHAAALSAIAEQRAIVERCVREVAELGAEVKDPTEGLVDFPAMRGKDLVYLCWKLGEPEVAHWHSLGSGFAGRKPLDDLARAAGR